MPNRLSRVSIGALVVAIPVATLILVGQTAPAAESVGVAGSLAAAPAPVVDAVVQVDLPAGKQWKDAAQRQRDDFRASRSSSPHRFGTLAYNKWFAKQYMQQEYRWGADQFVALEQLWQHESGWSQAAHNSSSGAHGIPQALPGSKMGMFGADWATNPETQIKWGLHYIESGYGSPSGALGFWHANNWY